MIDSNPLLVQRWRGDGIESLHRGAWVAVSSSGETRCADGDPDQLVYGRSSTKSFQALPLIESGAAEAFGLPTESLALALASHSGEPQHVEGVRRTLQLIGLTEDHLRCGPQAPLGSANNISGSRVQNNCSGKHAGFLAVSQHLGADPAKYLDPTGEVQILVRDALLGICDVVPSRVTMAVDGCSAPTFRLPLRALAIGIARIANPDEGAIGTSRARACRMLTSAATSCPELVAGSTDRLCTDLNKATNGRLFAKIGAEAVYVVGVVGQDCGLALKIDDGNHAVIGPVLIKLLRQLDLLTEDEAERLEPWNRQLVSNWDGLTVGRIEVVTSAH